jgi:signal transduction histidine kinase
MKETIESNAVARDATQDQLLRENARLRGDLLTIATRISHDLRTPLGGIVSTGELLKEILTNREPASATLVDSLFTSVDEMSQLIGQIRTIAKATAEPKPKVPVQIGMIVSGVLERLESRILNRQAAVAQPASWPEVNGVPQWLESVWWNLLMNALLHAGDQPRIELSWHQEENVFYFQVKDSGGGVPVDMHAKLFQPFDTLHQPGSTCGLGLSVVQRLVDLQGGRCGYQSTPAGGSCFYFTLPTA